MFWKEWDAVPSNIMENAVDKQFKKYSIYLHPKVWETMNLEDWENVPGIIRFAAFLKMIEEESNKKNIEDHIYEEIFSARQIMTGIVLTESFMEHKAVGRKDEGLTQISPYAKQHLKKYPEFSHLRKIDLFNPYISIKAGTTWFKSCLINAHNDLDVAIAAYNVGIKKARNNTPRAKKYRNTVYTRISDYITSQEPKSQTFRYVQKKVWSD